MENKTEYIGSQQQWEDSVNTDYDRKEKEVEEYNNNMHKEYYKAMENKTDKPYSQPFEKHQALTDTTEELRRELKAVRDLLKVIIDKSKELDAEQKSHTVTNTDQLRINAMGKSEGDVNKKI